MVLKSIVKRACVLKAYSVHQDFGSVTFYLTDLYPTATDPDPTATDPYPTGIDPLKKYFK